MITILWPTLRLVAAAVGEGNKNDQSTISNTNRRRKKRDEPIASSVALGRHRCFVI